MTPLREGAALAALALAFNALVWGVSWWPFRALEARGLHPLWATAIIYAASALAVILARPGALGAVMRHRGLWLIALASGATNAAFNWAVTSGDVVRVVLLFYLMPLWAVMLARMLLGERLHALALVRVVMALVGAAVVLGAGSGSWPVPATGIEWLAVLGGFSFALNNVMLRREAARSAASRTLAMFLGGAMLGATAGVALSVQGMPWPTGAAAWGWGVGALTLAFLASNLALQYGAVRLSANATAVIMPLEVLFASVSAWWLNAATLDARVLVGGALIVGAAVLAAWPQPTPSHPEPTR